MDIWKKIDGTEDYQISNSGEVKNSNRQLKPRTDKDGYLIIDIRFEEAKKTCRVHRLVSEAFIPNPENKPCVNHKDGNKKNNSVDNLEWCTYSENMTHAVKNGLWKSPKAFLGKFGKDHNKSMQVQCIETGIVYGSIHEASRITGTNVTSIWKVCRKKQSIAGGFHWQYMGKE